MSIALIFWKCTTSLYLHINTTLIFVSCLWTQPLSRNFNNLLNKVDSKDILFHFFHSFFLTDAYEDGVYLLTTFTANQVITLAHIYLIVTSGDFFVFLAMDILICLLVPSLH